MLSPQVVVRFIVCINFRRILWYIRHLASGISFNELNTFYSHQVSLPDLQVIFLWLLHYLFIFIILLNKPVSELFFEEKIINIIFLYFINTQKTWKQNKSSELIISIIFTYIIVIKCNLSIHSFI